VSENQALIFIPDISGFTRFVNNTEIQHSQHIIEELIEVILQSNDLDMKVSEIEGDAILFYRLGDAPTPDEIGRQTKKMFFSFHNFLQIIERDTLCQCGACRTASNLTLKFILHYGEIGISKIRKHTKLMGKNVILVHRLMKNDLKSDEYLLMTHDYISHHSNEKMDKHFSWSEVCDGMMNYEHIGDVEFKYVDLSPLRSQLKSAALPEPGRFPDPIDVTIYIDTPIKQVYNTIVDLSLRSSWTVGIKELRYDPDEILRVGSKHVCELAVGLIELETVQNKLSDGKIEYAEKAVSGRILPQATSFYLLKKEGQGTKCNVQFHYKKRFLIGWLINLILRGKLKKDFQKSMENLKALCESESVPIQAEMTQV
jgi:hypothetical protein